MATTIGSATAAVNIRLGQSPNIRDPALNYEMQLVYNSLHLLSQYMGVLRENLESAPGQTPSESVRFRRTFWSTALQDISVGAVCSAYSTGIINGVGSNEVTSPFVLQLESQVGDTGNRYRTWKVYARQAFVALTEAASGEPVQIGVGPGVIAVTGAKCGQVIWAPDSRSINSSRRANEVEHYYSGRTLVGNGGLYFNNITGRHYDSTGGYLQWEGYSMPGFPSHDGNRYYSSVIYLYPVGVCIADGFVLFPGYVRMDPPQRYSHLPGP